MAREKRAKPNGKRRRVGWRMVIVAWGVVAVIAVGVALAGGSSKGGASAKRTGTASRDATGPAGRFDACIGRTAPGLSASGEPVVNGAVEEIVDQLHGIVGGLWLYGSHAQAVANANVMTGYPVRIVRGAYMVDVNPHVNSEDSLAIQACAESISP